MVCWVRRPILHFGLYPSPIVISILILYEIAQINESPREILLILLFERIISFLGIGHSMFGFGIGTIFLEWSL